MSNFLDNTKLGSAHDEIKTSFMSTTSYDLINLDINLNSKKNLDNNENNEIINTNTNINNNNNNNLNQSKTSNFEEMPLQPATLDKNKHKTTVPHLLVEDKGEKKD
jgi:hypothetical protein